MARPITWQNVAAPDFRTALLAQGQAANLLSSAFEGISDTLGDIRGRQKTNASNAAQMEALKYEDPAAFQAMLKSQGLQGGLGISARDATPEFMDFVSGYRDSLKGEAQTVAQTGLANSQANRNNVLTPLDAALKQAQTDSYNSDTSWQDLFNTRQVASEDYTKNLASNGSQIAQQVRVGTRSLEEGERAIRNMQLPADLEKSALASLTDMGDAYNVSEASLMKVASDPRFVATNESISAFDRSVQQRVGTNPLLQLYSDSYGKFSGYGDPSLKLIETLKSKGVDDGILRTAPQIIKNTMQSLEKEFTKNGKLEVPREIIAQVVENNLQSGNWLTSDGLQPNYWAAVAELRELADPVSLRLLEQERAAIERDNNQVTLLKSELEKATQDLALAKERGNQNEIYRAIRAMNNVANRVPRVQAPQPAPPNTGPTLRQFLFGPGNSTP